MGFALRDRGNERKQKKEDSQYVRLPDINRQRLRSYAESFRQMAGNLREDKNNSEIPQENRESPSDIEENRQSILERQRHLENRQLISNHLEEVAKLMHKVAEQELCYQPLEPKKQKMVVHALRAEGIIAETLYYLPEGQASRSLGMILSTGKRGGVPSEEVANMLSVLLKCRLEASVTSPYMVDKEKRSFSFVEEEKLQIFLGLAKATKETESISGDNFTVLHSESGKKTILLSDGTGSGRRANAESSKVLDLMEKMMEAGFETEGAVNMVNTAIFTEGEEGGHPTLDICSVDLYSGICDIYKIGGASTFLKRGKHVDKLRRDSLPLGIFQHMSPHKQQVELMDGDYLILVTDGVIEALGEEGEEALERILSALPINNPQEMAERLLQATLKNAGGHIRDDMMILVAGVWEN